MARASDLWPCSGPQCQEESRKHPIYLLRFVGFAQDPDGPNVPGNTWQGDANLWCELCYLPRFLADDLGAQANEHASWKRLCQKSRQAFAGFKVYVSSLQGS